MKKVFFLIVIQVLMGFGLYAQVTTKQDRLNTLSGKYLQQAQHNKQKAIEYANVNNIPIRIENDTMVMELMMIDENEKPQYNVTCNANAAATSSTNQVYAGGAAGLSLDGSGISVCEWDGGSVRTTHQEFGGRVTNTDAASISSHSTHVAGTIMAAGVNPLAKGMAYAASLNSYDWNEDDAEMANEASNGNLLSNHSYSWIRGWSGSTWYGDPTISTLEDYRFGFYDYSARNWDEIAVNAPYYLIVKSSGNDRNDVAPSGGIYPDDGPWDCIAQRGIAKNVLTVGAVNDIVSGYSNPTQVVLASFSSCGPADDGRIKPDIVANGVGLTSTYSTTDDSYASLSGTSMSAPATTGSLALLVEHYENINSPGAQMRAATLKALVLHTADEAGSFDGPDYEFGWGLLNTQSAAAKITEDQNTDVISELVLANGETFTREITTTGTSPIRVTVVWTDPPGTPPAPSLDPADAMLVNDLDLRITESTNTHYPWKLDKDNPEDAATHVGENDVDNVEIIDIASPLTATTYTITVDHDGTLNSPQAFSMIISGDINNAVAPIADFYTDNTHPATEQTIQFIDATLNNPTSRSWSFSPTTVVYQNGTSSTSVNPEVMFSAVGTYEVSLSVTNAYGSDTEIKSGYITVGDAPSNYCAANSESAYGYISRVQMGRVDHASGFSTNSPYYQDWTTYTAGVVVGHTHKITVTNGSYDMDNDIAIWIDWNRDGDFEDANENIIYIDNNYGQGTFSIEVPIDAVIGKTRMRIRTKYYDDNAYSCGTTWYGEVEDYSIEIHPCITWSGATNNNWTEETNWVGGILPTSNDGVTIPAGKSVVVPNGTNAVCFSLKLDGNLTLEINGNLEIEN